MANRSVANVWMGRVDRLSGSSNAIVKAADAKSCHETDKEFDGEINLGPLPRDVVGQRVPFIYESGTYGLCLDEQWVSEAYLDDILSTVTFSVGEMNLRSAIIDANSADELPEGTVCTASPWLENHQPVDDEKGRMVVKLRSEDADSSEEQTYLGVIKGPVPPGAPPCTVQVTETNEVRAIVEPRTVELASGVPEVGEVCGVQIKDVSTRGAVAVYDADRSIPVLIPDVEYPTGKTLDVRITGQHAAYLTAEPELRNPDQLEAISAQDIDLGPPDATSRIIREGTPIDIRPLPTGAPQPDEILTFGKTENALLGTWNVQGVSDGHDDLTTGDTIEVTIHSIEEDRFVSFKGDFPIVCHTDTALPAELEGERLKVTIQSIAPDRATATLAASPFEEGDVVNIKADGSAGGDLFTVSDGHILQVASSGLLPSEQTFRAGIESSGPISRASVGALPEFRSDEKRSTLIRLSSTAGDLAVINGIPVDTRNLPDLTESVILGIEKIDPDHVVPSVAALPDSHIPEVDEHLIVTVEESTAAVTASAVGEELPIELWKPPSLKLERTCACVFECRDNKLRAVTTTIADDKSPEGIAERCQLASSLVTEDEYEGARSVLSAARSQLPSGYPIADAIIDARYALLRATDLLSNDTDRSITDLLHKARDKTSNIEERELSDDLSRLLEVYNLEVRAAIACIEAYENANRDTGSRLQAIARGAEAKEPVKEAIQKLRTASQRMTATEFDSASPSAEIMHFLRHFEEGFPYPIDELATWRANHEAHASKDEWLDAVFPVNMDSIGDQISYFELTSDDSRPGELWERSISVDETILQAPAGEGQNKNQNTAQKDGVEVSPPNQTAPTDPDRDKDDVSVDPVTDVTVGTTSDTSTETSDTSTSETAAANASETGSTQPAEREGEDQTADSARDGKADLSNSTESSAATSDSEDEDVDTSQARVSTEIPETTPKLQKLRKQAEADATENPIKHTTTTSAGSQYQRSDKIREYALARADGQCEACDNSAPFNRPSGKPFLEVHHVDELGKGGADDPTSVVAICPNCHREIHYGEYGDELNEELRNKLEEGLGDVGAA